MSQDDDNVIIDEQTEYDNFLDADGKIIEQPTSYSMAEQVGCSIKKEWEKEWIGMPEYEQEDNAPYKKITVSFKTKEDFEEFSNLIDQNLTEKTKSIWHPKLIHTNFSVLRWIEEGE